MFDVWLRVHVAGPLEWLHVFSGVSDVAVKKLLEVIVWEMCVVECVEAVETVTMSYASGVERPWSEAQAWMQYPEVNGKCSWGLLALELRDEELELFEGVCVRPVRLMPT